MASQIVDLAASWPSSSAAVVGEPMADVEAPQAPDLRLESVDRKYSLTAAERTDVLCAVFPNFPRTDLNRWRVAFEKTSESSTSLWNLVSHCAEAGPPLTSTAAGKQPTTTGSRPTELLQAPLPNDDGQALPFDAVVKYMQRRLQAMAQQRAFEEELQNAKPLPAGQKEEGLHCSICDESWHLGHFTFCANNHFACRACWHNFMRQTEGALRSMHSVPCITGAAQCKAVLALADVRHCLGPLHSMDAEERDTELSQRVALWQSGVKIYCKACKVVVGSVEEKDVGDGKVECPSPQCTQTFCAKCGQAFHGKDPCPPSREMDKFLTKNRNTKRCPQCGTGVTKNGGCNHMTCSVSARGCGHQFCWLCLGPYPKCNCGHFNSRSEQVASALQARESRAAAQGGVGPGRSRFYRNSLILPPMSAAARSSGLPASPPRASHQGKRARLAERRAGADATMPIALDIDNGEVERHRHRRNHGSSSGGGGGSSVSSAVVLVD